MDQEKTVIPETSKLQGKSSWKTVVSIVSIVSSARSFFVVAILAFLTAAVIGAFAYAAYWLSQCGITAMIAGVIVLFSVAKKLLAPLIVNVWKNVFEEVSAGNRGIETLFGKRTGIVHGEGLVVKVPFFGGVIIEPDKIQRLELEMEFPDATKTKWMSCTLAVDYRTDPEIKRNGKSVCIEADPEGIKDFVLQKLSTLGHKLDADTLLNEQPAIADYISSYLRLKKMPHKIPPEGQQETPFVDAKDIPAWYTTNHENVKSLIDQEHALTHEHSEVEEMFGVDIVAVKIVKFDFNEETKRAKKDEAEAQERAKVLEIRRDLLSKLVKPVNAGGPGATFQEAADQVNIALDPRIVQAQTSFQGLGSTPTVVVPANLFGGGGGRTGNRNEDDENNRSGGRKKGGRR